MIIAICGATGFIGTKLSRKLVNSGHEIVRIGREHFNNIEALRHSLEGCEAVINLSGAPIIKRWDESYKHELYISRIETTKKLLEAISLLEKKPSSFISASAVGIYKDGLVHDDFSMQYDTNYLALLAKEWENESQKSETLGLRNVIFRLGVVLAKDGGAVEEFKLAFKIGLGGIPGDGKQSFSWVHVDDVISVFQNAILSDKMTGIYNLVAPECVTMKTYMKTFGKILGRPAWFNISESMLKIKYAEGAESLLKGSFVVPNRLENEGYVFKYNNLSNALNSVLL